MPLAVVADSADMLSDDTVHEGRGSSGGGSGGQGG